MARVTGSSESLDGHTLPSCCAERAAHYEAADGADTVAVRRSALARLHRHISDAHERSPTRKLKQAIQIAEHMLNGDR